MFSAAADSVDIDVLLHPGPGDLNGCLIDVAGGPLGVLEHFDPGLLGLAVRGGVGTGVPGLPGALEPGTGVVLHIRLDPGSVGKWVLSGLRPVC